VDRSRICSARPCRWMRGWSRRRRRRKHRNLGRQPRRERDERSITKTTRVSALASRITIPLLSMKPEQSPREGGDDLHRQSTPQVPPRTTRLLPLLDLYPRPLASSLPFYHPLIDVLPHLLPISPAPRRLLRESKSTTPTQATSPSSASRKSKRSNEHTGDDIDAEQSHSISIIRRSNGKITRRSNGQRRTRDS
jgi:hypothetical protein